MQEKQATLFFLELLIIVFVLGFLSTAAIPHAGRMIQESKAMSREAELQNIQAAVIKMLDDSAAGKLESIGPIVDISIVHTRDVPPLVLKNYLSGKKDSSIKSGCAYGFAADGTILQIMP
jgi:hypothetical protein